MLTESSQLGNARTPRQQRNAKRLSKAYFGPGSFIFGRSEIHPLVLAWEDNSKVQ